MPLHKNRSPSGGGNGNQLQCLCLENPMDREAWQAIVYGIPKSQTQLKRLSRQAGRIPCHLFSRHPSHFSKTKSVCHFPVFSTVHVFKIRMESTPRESNVHAPWAKQSVHFQNLVNNYMSHSNKEKTRKLFYFLLRVRKLIWSDCKFVCCLWIYP